MEDNQFERRMKLLEKSYDRVPSYFNIDEVLEKIEEESTSRMEKSIVRSTKWQKVSVSLISVASILLVAMISASFREESNNQGVEELEFVEIPASHGKSTLLMPSNHDLPKSEVIHLPNSVLQQKVHEYFKLIGTSKNLQLLNQASAIEIVFLMHYMNELKNPDLIYYLYRPTDNFPNESEFITSWQPQEVIPKEATAIQYSEELTTEQEGKYYTTVEILRDHQVIKVIPLIRNNEGIWQFDYDIKEMPFDYYREYLLPINDEAKGNILNLYDAFKKQHDYSVIQNEPAIYVAGIYLEAFKKGDVETQYELLVKGEDFFVPSRDEFLSYPKGNALDWEEQFTAFEFFQTEDSQSNGEFNGIVWFYLNDSLINGDESRKGFQMRKTRDGWRVHFMPFQ